MNIGDPHTFIDNLHLYGLIFCPAADDHGMYPIGITMDNGIGHRL